MLLALLIALVLALVPFEAEAAKGGGFKHKFAKHKKPKNTGFKVTKKKFESSASCKAVASTKSFAKSVSVHKKAVASAFKYACKYGNPGHKRYVFKIYKAWVDKSKKSGEARAFAKAIAATKTTCKSKGNAYGCATAYAFSSAWAKANAVAIAAAWAEAISLCSCDGKPQVQAANADAYAKEVVKLVAKVKAVASSKVCTGKGARFVSAKDAQTCIQDIYAWVHAKAIAKAVIKGKCVAKKFRKKSASYSKFTAAALAKAKASIKVKELKGCVGKVLH